MALLSLMRSGELLGKGSIIPRQKLVDLALFVPVAVA